MNEKMAVHTSVPGSGTTTTTGSTSSSSSGQLKRKEIYKYVAPWTIYAMSWSVRHDKRFRLAIGSYIEEYNNKVGVISLHLNFIE